MNNMDECPICLSEIQQSESRTVLGCCGKSLHAVCYSRCMVSNATCPMCRAAHVSIDIPTRTIERTAIIVPRYMVPVSTTFPLIFTVGILLYYIISKQNCS